MGDRGQRRWAKGLPVIMEVGTTMFKVLIALNGSATSTQIIELASQLFAERTTDITLLHVAPLNLRHQAVPMVIVEGFEQDQQPAMTMAQDTPPVHLVSRHVIQYPHHHQTGTSTVVEDAPSENRSGVG